MVSVNPITRSERGSADSPRGSATGIVVVGATVVDVVDVTVVVVESVAATSDGSVVPGEPSNQPKAMAATTAALAANHAVRLPPPSREGGRNSGSIVMRSSAIFHRQTHTDLGFLGHRSQGPIGQLVGRS